MPPLSADLSARDGCDAPDGLLDELTTANAAGGTVVTFDDIANLLKGLPAYRYSGRGAILLRSGRSHRLAASGLRLTAF